MQSVQSNAIHTPSSDATLMSKGVLDSAILVNCNIAYYNYIMLLQAVGKAEVKSVRDMYDIGELARLLKRAELLAEMIIDPARRSTCMENKMLFIDVMHEALCTYTDLHFDSRILGTVSVGDIPGSFIDRLEHCAYDIHFRNVREAAIADYKKLSK